MIKMFQMNGFSSVSAIYYASALNFKFKNASNVANETQINYLLQ